MNFEMKSGLIGKRDTVHLIFFLPKLQNNFEENLFTETGRSDGASDVG